MENIEKWTEEFLDGWPGHIVNRHQAAEFLKEQLAIKPVEITECSSVHIYDLQKKVAKLKARPECPKCNRPLNCVWCGND